MNTYKSLIDDIKHNGLISKPRGQEVKELLFKDLKVTDHETIINSKFRNTLNNSTPEGKYLRAEFVWYMSGYMNPDYIIRFGKMWDKLRNPYNAEDDISYDFKILANKVNSNYGYHVFWKPVTEIQLFKYGLTRSQDNSPFTYVVKTLRRDISSRQAIIQYTLPNIYVDDVKDFTCTQNQHFLVREGLLYNLVHIRSSDAVKGLTFDIPWWDIVGQFVARALNVNYNTMLIHIGSAHYYERDYDLIDNMLKDDDIKWNKLILRDNNSLFKNAYSVYDKVHKYFMNTYPESKQEIVVLLVPVLDKLDNINNSETDFEYIVSAYLNMVMAFVYLATQYNIENDLCEQFNNMFFDSLFELL